MGSQGALLEIFCLCMFIPFSLPPQKEIERHAKAHQDHEASHQAWVKPTSIASTRVTADDCADDHHNRLWPLNNACDDKGNYRDAVDAALQYCLERVHLVNVL